MKVVGHDPVDPHTFAEAYPLFLNEIKDAYELFAKRHVIVRYQLFRKARRHMWSSAQTSLFI